MKNHLFFFSTDQHPSPFDVNIALDSGFDSVIPYGLTREEQAEALTHDVIFSRGPRGAKHSGIFIGGSDVALAERIASKVSASMVPPFVVSVFCDPKGAYTTGAALVAKARKAARGLDGKRILVFGGTGPVGGAAVALCASEGGSVTIISSRDKAAALKSADEISSRAGHKIAGESAVTEKERLSMMREADIAIAAVKAGVQVVSLEGLKTLKDNLVILDVNAAPPSGFGGLEPHDDMRSITPQVRGIGALAIGVVKYKTEAGLFGAMLKNVGNYGYKECYELAKTLA